MTPALTPEELAAKYGVAVTPISGSRGSAVVPLSTGGRGGGGRGVSAPGASGLPGNTVTDVLGGIADTTVRAVPELLRVGSHAGLAFSGDVAPLADDVKNAVGAQADQGRKAAESWRRGDRTEALGHAMAAALPLLGPAAAGVGETIGGELQYDDQGHPISVVREPQPARGVGQGMGLVGSMAAPGVGEVLGDVVDSSKFGIPGALNASAEKGYSQVLGATTRANKVRSGRVVSGYDAMAPELGPGATVPVPGLVDRGVMAVTRKGLAKKLDATVQDIGSRLENEWANIPADAGRPAADVYRTINDSLDRAFKKPDPQGTMQFTGPDAERGYDFGQSLKEYLKAHEVRDPVTGQQVIPYNSIKQFRQSWDDLVASKNAYAGGDLTNDVKATAYRASANGMRDILNSDNPTVSALNREYHFWQDASRVISDTVNRTASQGKSLGRRGAKMAGYLMGYAQGGYPGAVIAGKAMDTLESVVSSPGFKTVSSVLKNRLADAVASANAGKIGWALGQVQRAASATPKSPDVRTTHVGEASIGVPVSVKAPDGSVHDFDSEEEAQNFRDLIKQR